MLFQIEMSYAFYNPIEHGEVHKGMDVGLQLWTHSLKMPGRLLPAAITSKIEQGREMYTEGDGGRLHRRDQFA